MSIESKNSQKNIVQVAIDVPINRLFDYLWDAQSLGQQPERGMLVSVPFGKKDIVGVVINVSEESSYELDKIKKVRYCGLFFCSFIYKQKILSSKWLVNITLKQMLVFDLIV